MTPLAQSRYPTRPLAALAQVQLGRMLQPEPKSESDVVVPYLRAANVHQGRLDLSDVKNMFCPPSDVAALTLKQGDLLVCEGGDVGRLVLVPADFDLPTIFQNSVHRVVPHAGVDSRFLFYVLLALHLEQSYYTVLCNAATIRHLTVEKLKRLRLPMPPLEEQQRIAAFLDDQVALMEAAVALRGQQVDLHAERHATLIEDVLAAVQGVQVKATHVLRVQPGYAFPSGEFSPVEGPRLLRGANVGVDRIDWTDEVRWSGSDLEGMARFRLRAGDLVMGMDRPWISSGFRLARLGGSDLPALLLQRVARLLPGAEVQPDYAYWVYQSARFRESVEADLTGTSVPHLSGEQIGSYRFTLPGPCEQKRVVLELSESRKKTHRAARLYLRSVELLQERKRALIAAAVTGHLDVTTARSET